MDRVRTILQAGETKGAFRTGVDPIQAHWVISSLCFYRVSNRATWRENFGLDMEAPETAALQRRLAVETVLRFLAADGC